MQPSNHMLKAAGELVRRGWKVVPVPRGEKGPRLKNWQNLRLEEAELPKHFHGTENVGLLLGEPSRGLVDVDLDCFEAIAAAEVWLPPTQFIHGRNSKPRSHWWYVADPIPKPEKYADLDGTCLIELRSTGQQTLAPPSIHPTSEPLRWERDGDPAMVGGAELRRAVRRVAAASLLTRHWPAKGQRHDTALALAGMLLRGGWKEEAAMLFVSAVARAADDEESRTRMADVRSTVRRLANDQTTTGRSRLAELVGKDVVTRLNEWLTLGTLTNDDGSDPGPYRVEAGRICVERMKDHGPVRIPLCNFVAHVTEEILLDDGAETARAFVLQGELATGERLPPARVPASRFGGMTWVPDHWGLAAIVSAGLSTRDQLREAIQRLSPNPRCRQVFVHTGWRQIDEKWLYLTAGGAVGCDGFEVDLGHDLARYSLPRTPYDPRSAMRLSLRLLDIAPLTVTAPLWSAMFRAPLASAYPLDISIWLEGVTGSLKSTLVALFLCHYGAFERTSLPGAWSSTANQLERRAFILKDAAFVVDDYAPSALDARELEAKAARLLRSQGNLSGRARLRADLTERPAYPPRGLIVGTGEQHPPGQGLLARMLLAEMERSKVNLAALSKAQDTAARLAHAMGGYLLWLAPQMPGLPTLLRQTFDGARSRATAAGEHLRVPEALANLWMGLHCALSYAEEVRACTHAEAEEHRDRCWDALLTVGGKQAQVVEAERPSRRFLSVLVAMLSQGQMVLLPKETIGNNRRDDALVGWQDEESIYLTPESAYQAVARFCRDTGELFPVRQQRLLRDLALEGLTECDPGRHTTTAWIGGRTRRVLRLRRQAVETLLGEELPSGLTAITTLTGPVE